MAMTEDTALEAAADCEPVTVPNVPSWVAFQALGEHLEQLELRLIRMHDSAGEHRQQQLESVFRVFQTVQRTYRKVQCDLIRKALGG